MSKDSLTVKTRTPDPIAGATPTATAPRPLLDRSELLDLIRKDPHVADDYHPVHALAVIANNDKLPLNLKIKAHSEVASYITPKLKAIEHRGEGGPIMPVLNVLIQTIETDKQP